MEIKNNAIYCIMYASISKLVIVLQIKENHIENLVQ